MTAPRKVWCLLLSPDKTPIGRPLSVEVSPNDIVAKLKEKIKEKKPNRLQDVDPDELAVWKCKEPTSFDWTDSQTLENQVRQVFSENKVKILVEDTEVSGITFATHELLFARLPHDAMWQRHHAPSCQVLDNSKPSKQDISPLNHSKVKKTLSENGYQILEEEEVEGWTRIDPLGPFLRRAKLRNGDVVVVKLLKKDSMELDVLRSLNRVKSEANHVVDLLESLHLEIGTIIILPLASPLRCIDSVTAHRLMHQLVGAVGFIHGNGVAHLDLKPNNILVNHAHNPPRLVVIDFSVSVFANSPEFRIEGFVGTPHWTAPEIGTVDGPPQTYSPIRADLWSCGKLMGYIADRYSIRDDKLLQLMEELLSLDPLERPLLQKESNVHPVQPKLASLIYRS